ncbi:unnamed protein product [Caretta caretta]
MAQVLMILALGTVLTNVTQDRPLPWPWHPGKAISNVLMFGFTVSRPSVQSGVRLDTMPHGPLGFDIDG